MKPEALSYRFADKTIADLVQMDLGALATFFHGLDVSEDGGGGVVDTAPVGADPGSAPTIPKPSPESGTQTAISQPSAPPIDLTERQRTIARPIVKEIRERLDFMVGVGVEYLNLDRPARTLSGGESQRIRLATQIGTQLTGVLYVLDEPSIGLHPRDNTRLINSLRSLRDLGNSVLVVEHDREMIEAADYVVDMGPGAGELGGHITAAGPQGDLRDMDGEGSLTNAYLDGTRHVPIPTTRSPGNGDALVLSGARGHNLKGDTLTLPLGTFTAVTGVSGSGKSSLINQTLYPLLAAHHHNALRVPLPHTDIQGLDLVDKVIDIDQSPIGRTPRSNPATYTGLFTHLRDLFTQLPESKIRGYKPGRFSFNVKGGRCEACKGAGIVKLEMNFLPDVYVTCDTCKGKRYNAETLQVRYNGRNIADVLDMTVDDALALFEAVPRIKRKLKTLASVGLGYIRLGQQATTVSGGEAQRIKLAKELSRPGTGQTLYILDEPTTGLHFEDIRHLLAVLRALVDKGQHGPGDRAQHGRGQSRRPRDRPGADRRARRRSHPVRRNARRASPAGHADGSLPQRRTRTRRLLGRRRDRPVRVGWR